MMGTQKAYKPSREPCISWDLYDPATLNPKPRPVSGLDMQQLKVGQFARLPCQGFVGGMWRRFRVQCLGFRVWR